MSTLLERTFEEIFSFSRPQPAEYVDQAGATQEAGVDEPRFEYLEGEPQGLRMGDGDSLSLSLAPWYNELEGGFLVRVMGKEGDRIFSSGAYSQDEGVEGWKTYVRLWNESSVRKFSGSLHVFPDSPDDGEVRYVAGMMAFVLPVFADDLGWMTGMNRIINRGFF